ncbi:MAG: thiamine phosphate synthase [Gammaproteobacteria bacterium]|nr:thiamine phosphate synthase [Gammaproteobacteria bacterium]
MIPFPGRGLYAITPDGTLADGELVSAVAAAIEGGAVAVQYRNKHGDPDRRRAEAARLASVCGSRGVPLIINDDVDLAATVGADGVHVGKDDMEPATARRVLGPDAIVGVSCYASTTRAVAAAAAGADYVAFGRFFPSVTKPGAPGCTLSLLKEARGLVSLPLVAIGGIDADNGTALIEAGADLLAVIHDVFGRNDPRAAAARLAGLFG